MMKRLMGLLMICLVTGLFSQPSRGAGDLTRPHIVLVMADDMGWGETSRRGHPCLKTPNLDEMSEHGLWFERFYAGAPVCSPTRASVLTGRSNRRTGVESHGYALRLQEKTVAQALKSIGYVTGHFGKWHLNGMRGPGVPILGEDPYRPDQFGFDEWLSVTNFFDRDPLLSRKGKIEDYTGDSSEVVVAQALDFLSRNHQQPTFTIIWYGTPHSPFKAAPEDYAPFTDLDEQSMHHYGELVAMDRSIGTLRKGLADLGMTENTLLWFCSDNGGLPKITPETVGGLRGFKGSLYEGGLRVPCIIEWPARIKQPRTTEFPGVTMDIFPTIAEITGLSESTMIDPIDGVSLVPLFDREISQRAKPIGFQCLGNTSLLKQDQKIMYVTNRGKKSIEFYDLSQDPHEEHNLYSRDNPVAVALQKQLDDWIASVNRSIEGKDYPAGKVDPPTPEPRGWNEVEAYQKYFPQWSQRWEYEGWLKRNTRE